MHLLDPLLERFDAARSSGPYSYPRHHHHDGGEHNFHLVLGSIVHGEEVGSLPTIVSLVEALQSGTTKFGGKLTVFLGNPEASARDRRFLEADLNRVFVDEPPACHEGDRARELKPILATADLFVDFHQTILGTDRAFYIFPFDVAGWHWARAIGGASTWVTRPPSASFSAGTCCADEFVRQQNKPGVTLELGQKGFSDETDQRAELAVARLLAVADAVGSGSAEIEQLAAAQPELDFVHTTWRKSFDDARMRLRPGLINFQPVVAGERLSAKDTPRIEAPHDGMVLFPKYPEYANNGEVIEPRPGEIVHVVKVLDEHPTEIWSDELEA